jgi:DNA-binding transcriptional MerR regulator
LNNLVIGLSITRLLYYPITRLLSDYLMRLKKTYSSREVAALTGLSARQLQVWDAGGLLSPTIPSHKTEAGGYTERRYTPIELFELLVLADLRRRGFSIHQLHQLLRILQEQFGERLFDATGGGGSVQLLTDGREIYARTASGGFFNLLKMPTQPLLVVGNEGLLRNLSSSIRPRRRKKTIVSGKSSRGRRRAAE